MPVLGAVPRDATLAMPERHLGLVQAGEHADLAARLDRLADMAERHLDLEGIIAAAAPLGDGRRRQRARRCRRRGSGSRSPRIVPFRSSIPMSSTAGAVRVREIVAFSPLADEPPPADCDSCWLPGGYPELHAGALAAARRFRDGLARFAATRPVHGECGGYMVLGGGARGCRRRAPCHDRPARTRDELCRRASCISAIARRGFSPVVRSGRPAPQSAATNSTTRRSTAPGQDEPLVDLIDGQGHALGTSGGRRGHVTGAFFHAIAREVRP